MASATISNYLGTPITNNTNSRKATVALWTVQALLAALFLFAGAMKFVTPIAVLEQQAHMSGLFLRFIGVCELLGALGLILPGLTRIRTGLTPLAATGLVIIMFGAVVITIATQGVAMAIVPAVIGVFAAAVAYGRWALSPLHTRVNA
jgi:uncharacterized membrane protein YphA (DoxX/SURF4 family)